MKQTYYIILFSFVLTSNLFCIVENRGAAWRKKAFDYIYANKHWAKEEGLPHSGPGSTLQATTTLRAFLPVILETISAKSMLDAGCGDFTWMQETVIDVEKYIGIDIVENLIQTNKRNYENGKYTFLCKDVTKDPLPKVDVILCRDCLAHLSLEDITETIKNFKKSGSKYLLTSTFPKVTINYEIESGGFRGVNLRAYPFHFPVPIMLFKEISAEANMLKWGKWIALWKLEDITI